MPPLESVLNQLALLLTLSTIQMPQPLPDAMIVSSWPTMLALLSTKLLTLTPSNWTLPTPLSLFALPTTLLFQTPATVLLPFLVLRLLLPTATFPTAHNVGTVTSTIVTNANPVSSLPEVLRLLPALIPVFPDPLTVGKDLPLLVPPVFQDTTSAVDLVLKVPSLSLANSSAYY